MKSIVIKDNKFKSVFVSVNLLLPLVKEDMSKNALIAMVLKKSSKKYGTEKELERKLAKLYNASLRVNVEKYAKYYNIEFGIEVINKKYIDKDVLEEALNVLKEIIYNPNIKNEAFDKTLVEREKEGLINIINEQKDQKRTYAINKVEEYLFENEDYGYPLLGKEEDYEKIDEDILYEYYKKIVEIAKIKVIVNGNLDGYEDIEEKIEDIFNVKNSEDKITHEEIEIYKVDEPKIYIENQDISQSVLTFGIRLLNFKKEEIYKAVVLNAILGGTPSSKLFQNIREKQSLAYFAKSMYNKQKNAICIAAGIEPKNYLKAKELIQKEIDDLINGNITDEEFITVRDYIVSTYKEIKDSKAGYAKFILANSILYDEIVDLEDIIKEIQELQKEDVLRIATKINVQTIFLLGGREND